MTRHRPCSSALQEPTYLSGLHVPRQDPAHLYEATYVSFFAMKLHFPSHKITMVDPLLLEEPFVKPCENSCEQVGSRDNGSWRAHIGELLGLETLHHVDDGGLLGGRRAADHNAAAAVRQLSQQRLRIGAQDAAECAPIHHHLRCGASL